MGIRLNKVTRQLNVGVRTIVQFLKMHRIGEIKYDSDSNTKISENNTRLWLNISVLLRK